MYHLVSYNANTFGVSNFSLTPAQDSILTISNGHYLPSKTMYLLGGWVGGVNLTSSKLVTPRSRQVVPPVLYPLNNSILPPDRPHIIDRRSNPFTLNAVEEIDIQVNLGGAANSITTAILALGDGIDPVPKGDIYSLHGAATAAAVANTWTQMTPIWDQTLPAGTYTVIGSQHQSTNGIAHRWIFKTQVYRPGFLSIQSLTQITDPSVYQGGWGAWGMFNTYTFPVPEVYCNGADAAHDFVLFLIKTG